MLLQHPLLLLFLFRVTWSQDALKTGNALDQRLPALKHHHLPPLSPGILDSESLPASQGCQPLQIALENFVDEGQKCLRSLWVGRDDKGSGGVAEEDGGGGVAAELKEVADFPPEIAANFACFHNHNKSIAIQRLRWVNQQRQSSIEALLFEMATGCKLNHQ